MIEFKEIDPTAPFMAQLRSDKDGPVTIINIFVAPRGQVQAVLDAWKTDAAIMMAQPGSVSAQLYPDGTVVYPQLAHKVAVDGICGA